MDGICEQANQQHTSNKVQNKRHDYTTQKELTHCVEVLEQVLRDEVDLAELRGPALELVVLDDRRQSAA